MKSIPLDPEFVFNQPRTRTATADYLLEVTIACDSFGSAQYNDPSISSRAGNGGN